jgi:tetratricopeptide (TPR) repeat protein
MFEFSRELKRLLAADGPRDGFTGGDASLLEVFDLCLLRTEARAADIAAGRISARDPSQRRLDAAHVWRELARRTGDLVALRRAAEAAEKAANGFKRDGRMRGWAAARGAQAQIAMLGADLYGDEGLNAAAALALNEARNAAPNSVAGALAWAGQARLAAAQGLAGADMDAVRKAAAGFDGPIQALEGHLRARTVRKIEVAAVICDKAEVLMAAAARCKDYALYEDAIRALDKLAGRLDPIYEPLTWSRVRELRGAARAAIGELHGLIEDIAAGVESMADALDVAGPDHSPMDSARLQHGLAVALQALGEASDCDRAFEHALGAYDRALWAIREHPALLLRAALAHNRAGCLARRAEIAADASMLDDAVEVLKRELTANPPARDPVQWAVAQVNLARLYEARSALPGGREDARSAAVLALSAAIDVFGERGLRSLADQAARGLERLSGRPARPATA